MLFRVHGQVGTYVFVSKEVPCTTYVLCNDECIRGGRGT